MVGNIFKFGCTGASFLDLLISVERCTVNIEHNYNIYLLTHVYLHVVQVCAILAQIEFTAESIILRIHSRPTMKL